PIFLMWFGTIPVLVIGRPELGKQLMGDKIGNYGKGQGNQSMADLLGGGLVNLNGEKWARHRRIIKPSFHIDKLKDMVSSMVESITNTLDKWAEVIKKGENEVDVSQELKALTSDIIARTAFGSSYIQGKRIFDMLAQQLFISIEDNASLMIPGYRFLPFKRNRESWRIRREIRSCLKQLILSRETSGRSSTDGYGNDLLGNLMSTNQEMQKTESDPRLTIDEIIEECKTFFFAGEETTSGFLTYVIVLLAMHPEWQERARAEIVQLGLILKEVMRLYPPAPAFLREACKDTELGGISIPTGTNILFPLLSLNHDTRLWGEDANQFKPQRFSEGISKATKEDSAVFLPFGYGLRSCIGQAFATLSSKVVIAMILQRFTFALSPAYIHAPISFVNMFAQHGAHIILHDLQMDG
ncbi:hypothetical protein KI387_035756, partial [Taxus chinensis]